MVNRVRDRVAWFYYKGDHIVLIINTIINIKANAQGTHRPDGTATAASTNDG
jgi:hypothetical protein